MLGPFDIRPLDATHDRAAFSCGEPSLDVFLKTKARKEAELDISVTFVAAPIDEPARIAGFYSLSALSIELSGLDEDLAKKLPKYPHVPVTLLGRLACDRDFKGRRLGEMLLMDALKKAHDASQTIGSLAVVVDPLHAPAAAFYARYGFATLPGDTMRMMLAMKTIGKLGL